MSKEDRLWARFKLSKERRREKYESQEEHKCMHGKWKKKAEKKEYLAIESQCFLNWKRKIVEHRI